MSCDERSATHASGPPSGAVRVAPLRPAQPGSVLRRLEAQAQAELRQLLAARAPALQSARIEDPVWAGLAWDMGLNGAAIAAAGKPLAIPGAAPPGEG